MEKNPLFSFGKKNVIWNYICTHQISLENLLKRRKVIKTVGGFFHTLYDIAAAAALLLLQPVATEAEI